MKQCPTTDVTLCYLSSIRDFQLMNYDSLEDIGLYKFPYNHQQWSWTWCYLNILNNITYILLFTSFIQSNLAKPFSERAAWLHSPASLRSLGFSEPDRFSDHQISLDHCNLSIYNLSLSPAFLSSNIKHQTSTSTWHNLTTSVKS